MTGLLVGRCITAVADAADDVDARSEQESSLESLDLQTRSGSGFITSSVSIEINEEREDDGARNNKLLRREECETELSFGGMSIDRDELG